MSPAREHKTLREGLERLAAEPDNWSSSAKGERVLRTLIGAERGSTGLRGILVRHRPRRALGPTHDTCTGCPPYTWWRDCPEVKVVRLALVVADVLR